MSNKMAKNVIANTVGKIWTALAALLFVPVYVRLLGEEAYGIVTFFAVLQSVLNIMGVGLQKTLRREFANGGDGKSIGEINQKKYKLLRSCEFIYLLVCIIIFLICSLGSTYIAGKWLNYKTLSASSVALTISLMGVSIGLQLVANLYQGCIYGLDHQSTANLFQVIWVTVKNAGVILILKYVSNTITSFYIWTVLTDTAYCSVCRISLLRMIPFEGKHSWHLSDISNIKDIWKYAFGLFIISIGSILNTQLDKIVMSRYLSVTECGAYNSTYHLASFCSYIPTILGTAIFSNVASLIFEGNRSEAKKIFEQYNIKSIVMVSAIGAFLSVFSYEIILLWTGSSNYAEIMKTAAPMVVIGLALNALQQMPYDYLLASGNTRVNEIQLLCCIPYVLLVTFNLTRMYGINGAAIAWIVEMLISTTLYLLFFYRFSFGTGSFKMVLKNYLIFALAFIPALVIKGMASQLKISSLLTVMLAFIGGTVTLIVLFWIFDRQFLISIKNRVMCLKS